MKIPIDGVQAFVQIDELGSFSRAAERLAITQTALSRRMQRLESFVGMRLLDRTTRSVSLTAAGREFLPLARRLVDDLVFGLDNLRNASRLGRGDVAVATLQSIAIQHLPPMIQRYATSYPQNNIKILERSGSLVTEAVLQGEADFGIHIIQGDGSTAALDEKLLVHSPFMLICCRDHPLAKQETISWPQLAGMRLITLGGASGNRRIVEEQLANRRLDGSSRLIVESTTNALALVKLNLGVAILPGAISKFDGELVAIPLIDPTIHRSIGLVKRQNRSLTPAAQALYDIVRQSFGDIKTALEGG